MKDFARLNNVPVYIDIALENFKIATAAKVKLLSISNMNELDDIEKEIILIEYERESHKHSITTVVFISMAIEAYIYDYSARELSDNYAKTYLDKLDIISKWVVIPKLITGKEFPANRQGFQLLKEIFGYRNKLVHFKSTNITPEKLEEIHKNTVDSFEMASKAIRCLIELSKDITSIDPHESIEFLFDIVKCKEALKNAKLE